LAWQLLAFLRPIPVTSSCFWRPEVPAVAPAALRTCRILYYGPAGTGKRENLARIQQSLPAEHRLALATEDPSRQMAFLLRNAQHGDWQVFVQTVDAGQEQSLGLSQRPPFDGIVFVCSSAPDRLDQALSAMESLKGFLDTWNRDLMSVPVVLQYNARDNAPVLPIDRLESLLNPWGLLAFPANVGNGGGVREALRAILSLTIGQLLQKTAAPVEAVVPQESSAGFDLSPPVPGTPHTPGYGESAAPVAPVAPPPGPVASAPVAAAAPALVVPVRIPRSALGTGGAVRLILELQIEDR
jgi:mutual gliding-motility protein MglA